MCHADDSIPPIDRIEGGVAGAADIVLTAGDGNRFAAFRATSADSKGPAIVILPDVRGLHPFYVELALRFAEHGYDAVAIDYFGRTAGVGRRDESFPYADHVPLTTLEGVTADTAAAVALVRDRDPDRAVFTLGFCFGGSNSWHQAAGGHRLAGAIGFYGNPKRPPLGPIERVGEFVAPVLALMGGDDPGIPTEVVEEFAEALRTAEIEHEVVIYPDAPHSFFDRKQDQFADDAADAWRRALDFVESHS